MFIFKSNSILSFKDIRSNIYGVDKSTKSVNLKKALLLLELELKHKDGCVKVRYLYTRDVRKEKKNTATFVFVRKWLKYTRI